MSLATSTVSHKPVRIVVTGAGGCIGSNLVPMLKTCGCDVLELGDAAAAEMIPDDASFDVFVNLAWCGSRGPKRADYALQLEMVRMSLDYYQLALRLGCRRFICPGTIGELMIDLPECQNIRSQNFVYVNAKSFLHRLLQTIEHPNECRVVWARLGNLYGRDDSGNLLNWTLSRILVGEKAVFGPARQPYEFIAVEDCVRALAGLAMAPTLSKRCYYVGVGEPCELGELLREVGRIAKREDMIVIGGRPDDGTRYHAEWFDIAPLTADTGYRPQISFVEGVGRLVVDMKRRIGDG